MSNSAGLLERGLALYRAGQISDAEDSFRRILIDDGNNPDAHHLLGVAAMDTKRRDIAGDHLRKAVRLRPDSAQFHNSLGVFRMRDGSLAQGIHHFWQSLALQPDNLDALKNLIVALRDIGDFDEVIRLCERAIELDGELVDLPFHRARALQALDRLKEASTAYREILERVPAHAPSLTELGYICLERDEIDEAAQCLEQAVDSNPADLRALNGLGHVFDRRGDIERSVGTWERALELEPRAPAVLTSLGITLIQIGQNAEGRACLERAIEAAPRHAEAHLAFVQSARVADGDPEIVRLQSIIDSDGIPDEDRVKLLFSLGKALEDTGRPDDAFLQYASANRLKRSLIDFSIERSRSYVNSLIAFFTSEFLHGPAAAHGVRSELPVFVVGMPRSGTTLVEQILASHPQVHGAGELPHVEQIITRLPLLTSPRVAWPACLSRLEQEDISAVAASHLDKLRAMAPEAARVVDKMPRNSFNLGLLAVLFPQARFIHCRRDPRDVCLSCFTRYFSKGQPFSWDLVELGQYYREYERLSRHWQHVLGDRILDVRYEELTADTESGTRRLLDFIGMQWHDRCLEFHRTDRRITTNPVQVRQPVYRSSVARWRRFESHLGPLIDALGEVLDPDREQA